jgi:hypothetical protein
MRKSINGVAVGCNIRGKLGALMATKKGKRWSAKVTTDSTHPPKGLFTKNAAVIARTLASKKVSPKGPGSGLRMLLFFINRAGRTLTPVRRAELRKAKTMLSQRIDKLKLNDSKTKAKRKRR